MIKHTRYEFDRKVHKDFNEVIAILRQTLHAAWINIVFLPCFESFMVVGNWGQCHTVRQCSLPPRCSNHRPWYTTLAYSKCTTDQYKKCGGSRNWTSSICKHGLSNPWEGGVHTGEAESPGGGDATLSPAAGHDALHAPLTEVVHAHQATPTVPLYKWKRQGWKKQEKQCTDWSQQWNDIV